MAKRSNVQKRNVIQNKSKIKNNINFETGLYKIVAEETQNVIYEFSTVHGNLAISSNCKSIIGYSDRQLTQNPKLWENSIHELDSKLVSDKLKSLKINEIIEIEYRFNKPDGKVIWLRDRLICTHKKSKETIVQGLATDITKQKKAEVESEQSLRKFESIFNQASDGIIVGIQNEKIRGQIIEVNNSILNMTGYKKSELIGKNISFLFRNEELKEKPLKYDSINKGELVVSERRIKLKNKKLLPIEMRSKLMTDGTLVTFIRDVSESYESKRILEESEKRYRSLIDEVIESSSVGIFILDAEFKIVWINSRTEKFFGIKKNKVIGEDKTTLINKKIKFLFDKPDDFAKRVITSYKHNSYVESFECHIVPKGRRKERWLLHWSQPITTGLYKGGRIEHYMDITDQKIVTEYLRQSENKFEIIFKETPLLMSISEIKTGKYLEVNNAFLKTFGYKKAEVIGKTSVELKFISARDRNAMKKELLSKGRVDGLEFDLTKKRGDKFHIRFFAEVVEINGQKRLLSVVEEITKQKTYREFLTKYKNIVSSTQDAISLVDKNYTYLIVNDTYLKRSGLKREDIIGKSVAEYLGKSVFDKYVKPRFDKCLKGETIKYQEWFDYKVAGKKFIDVTYFPYYDSDNKITGVIANSRDITDKHLVEDALRESESRFRVMADTAPVLIWMSDITKKCTYFNKIWLDFTGRTLEQELGDGWAEGVHKDDLEPNLKIYTESFDKRVEFKLEYRLRHKDGSYRWIYDHGVPRYTEEGKFVGYIGSCIDINAQRELRESYRVQSEMLQNMAEGTSLVRASDGIILYTNPSYNKLLGYKDGELIGKHISTVNAQTDITPEDVAAKIIEVLRQDNYWQGEVLNKRKDGSTVWTYATVSTYHHWQFGDVWIAAQSDITTQKEYEAAQRKERGRLEIMHDLYSETDKMSNSEMYQYVVDKAVDLTDSSIGFFHRIHDDQETIVLTAWSTETLKECNAVFDDHYPIDKSGNWAECISTRKPVVYNDFKLSPKQKGLPEGHLKIQRMMSVPIIYDGKVRFVLGVGNKKTIYNEGDILQFQLLADELSKIISNRETKANLLKSNERLKEAEHIGGIGYYYFTLTDGKAIWSDETFRLFNRDPKLGAPTVEEYLNYVHPDDIKSFTNDFEAALSDKQSFDYEYRILVDLEIKFLQTIGKIRLDSKNNPISVSGIVKDITAFKLATLSIKENEEKFEKAFKTSPDALAITSIKEGKYIDVNDSFKRILGYEPREMIGKTVEELNIWRFDSDRERLVKGLKEKGYVENLDAEYFTKSGNIMYGLMSARLVKLGDEDVILSITRDITERKAMEKAIEQSEIKYKKLISNISDVIVVIDKNGKIAYKSTNIKKHFGWDPEELIGKDALYTCHPDDYERIYAEMERLLIDNNLQVRLEMDYRCKDGTYKPIELTAISLIDDPIINGIIANYKDISERKKAEKAIVETQRLGAIGEMSSAIAHDFNNSLQSIFGNLELAIMNLENNHQCHRFLESIKIATTDAATRVKLLQRFAGTSKTREEYFELDINQLIKDVIIQSRPMWKNGPEKKGVTIYLEAIYGDTKNIMGSEGELRSVLYNMIKNSVEAMPNGGTITLSTYSENNHSCIQLNDNGIGMNEETKSRMFQPFFTTKGFESGRGMGMSGAYSIVKEHSGNIYVKETAANKGTTIIIEIPEKEKIEKPEELKEQKSSSGNKLNILWIDDEKAIRDIAIEMIEVLGHSGKVLSTADEAMEIINNEEFDLVLTDIGMPGMNGWELADKIKDIWGNQIKIGVVSGWGDQISSDEMEKHGVSLILAKPFGIDDFENLIGKVIK